MGTHYQGTRPEVRALNTYIKLMRAADSVASRLARRLAPTGLTESQFGVLEILLHLGPQPQRAIGRKLFSSSSNVTTVVDNLESRGLAARVRDSVDRRQVIVRLTPAGRELVSTVFPAQLTAIVDEFSALTPDEQDELGRLCKKLGLRPGEHPRRAAPAPGRRRGGRTP